MEKEISCRTTNAIIQYIKDRRGTIEGFLDGLEYDEHYLTDTNNWISRDFLGKLHRRLHELYDDEDLSYKVGCSALKLGSLGFINFMVRLFGSPQTVISQIARLNAFFNRIRRVEVLECKPGRATVSFQYLDGRKGADDECAFTRGLLSVIPEMWNLGPVKIREECCSAPIERLGKRNAILHKVLEGGDVLEYDSRTGPEEGTIIGHVDADGAFEWKGTKYGASRCLYHMTWKPYRRRVRGILSHFFIQPRIVQATIEEMENEHRRIEERYDELSKLNEQLEQKNSQLEDAKNELEAYKWNLEQLVENRSMKIWQMQDQLIQSEKHAAVGRLAATVAHEVNNPLAIIQTSLMLLRRSLGEGDPGLDQIRGIDKEINRLSTVINQLLDLSRPADDDVNPCDVNEIVGEVISLVGSELVVKKVALTNDLTEEKIEVLASPNQIKQVMLNLVTNAEDAMPDGGSLDVKTERQGRQVIITFSDTGCGMAEDQLAKIFDPFFTTKKHEGGVGLGLSVSSNIIRTFNGTIEAVSTQGEGSTFKIALPMYLG
ncbi:sensor histidine kinase [Thermodesulfobacteriota bacterium]